MLNMTKLMLYATFPKEGKIQLGGSRVLFLKEEEEDEKKEEGKEEKEEEEKEEEEDSPLFSLS